MGLRPWEQLNEERLVRYKVFDVRRSVRRSPRTGVEHGIFTIDTLEWVHIVAISSASELILVRQYRHGSRTFSLEIPGGVVGPEDPDPAATAARELREETGYEAARWVALGSTNPNPALFTNRLHTFLATGCERVGDLIQDSGEDLEVVLMPVAEVEQRIRAGAFDNALVLAGLCRWLVERSGR
jgi:8-oxo-dGTP pyrophosphatase MutT (NUDIX family)